MIINESETFSFGLRPLSLVVFFVGFFDLLLVFRLLFRVLLLLLFAVDFLRLHLDEQVGAGIGGQAQVVLLRQRRRHESSAQEVVLAGEVLRAQFGRRQRDETLGLNTLAIRVAVLNMPA